METNVNVYHFLTQITSVLGLMLMLMVAIKNIKWSVNVFLGFTLVGLAMSVSGLIFDLNADLKISYLLSCLILFVSLNIQKFSIRYMNGDSAFSQYFIKLALLTVSSNAMVLTTSQSLFWLFWTANGLILASLMIHKSQWQAAKNSGIFTALTLCLGSGFLALSFLFPQSPLAPWFLVLAAMCQSAIWPFHRWLLSSLNSPTPVSALMHAGIVNGGGILLVKYHQLFSQDISVMIFIFSMGCITALLGGLWKLIQVDIKKMLANSTMAQMGFMFMQCGMGLFPAAVAHLCWHGLFKAYLFLNAGSALQSRFEAEQVDCDFKHYLGVVLSTILALGLFIFTANLDLSEMNTRWILLGMVAITVWQLSKGLVGKNHLFLDMTLVSVFAGIYGLSLRLIESCFHDDFALPQALHPVFVLGFVFLLVLWLLKNSRVFSRLKNSKWGLKAYMCALNASQPYTKTMTLIRQTYQI
jgi:NAD(P)H-quinone oxidoreductase subunit 5